MIADVTGFSQLTGIFSRLIAILTEGLGASTREAPGRDCSAKSPSGKILISIPTEESKLSPN